MKRIDFTKTGGFPLDQEVLDYLQQSYRDAFSGIAGMVGNKVIMQGVELVAGAITPGWISYNGELLPFVGGAQQQFVSVSEVKTTLAFEDGGNKEVLIDKRLVFSGAAGDFEFTELTRMSSLINIWQPGDIKDKYVSQAYADANFDAITGEGTGPEKGWAIMSKKYPSTEGTMLESKKDGVDLKEKIIYHVNPPPDPGFLDITLYSTVILRLIKL